MFRTLGKKTELHRYKVTYTENGLEVIKDCISEEHKNEIEQLLVNKRIEFTTETIDQTANEWFNGLEFESYDKALSVFNAGEEVYNKEKLRNELSDNLRLRADIDYITIMTGVGL